MQIGVFCNVNGRFDVMSENMIGVFCNVNGREVRSRFIGRFDSVFCNVNGREIRAMFIGILYILCLAQKLVICTYIFF